MKLFYHATQLDLQPKGAVIVIQGLGDDSGGMKTIVESLIELDYAVYTFDLHGYGKSTGIRDFIQNWEEYIGDLHAFHQFVAADVLGLPLFIAGHCLGGVIALDNSLKYGKEIAGGIP